MKVTDLKSDEYASYYANYINQVSDEYTLVEELEISLHRLIKFVQNIPMDKFDYRYAEEKWTVKDIIQHIIDAERVFIYRALRFSRNDFTNLAGFDENEYVVQANGNKHTIVDLLSELSAVRQSTILFFKSLNNEELMRKGFANNVAMSVRAFGFVIIGHENHHIKIFKERYL